MSQAQLLESLAAEARTLDAADPLAAFREQFELPVDALGKAVAYLCGHSLGAMPRQARRLLQEELDQWSQLAVRGHHEAKRPWIDYATALKPPLARLVGGDAQDVVAMNALSVNLHLMLASFYRPQGRRRLILIESGAFSSDFHAVASQIAWHGLDPQACLLEVKPNSQGLHNEAALEQLLHERGAEVALVLWPGVQYLTGQAFDLRRITRAAHAAGAVAGFDLAHAIGNVPLNLQASDADFAVWCSYKYLNAGPGAVGGAYVHQRHARNKLPGLAGWWGHEPATRFRMESRFAPAAGADAWQVSNPPVLSSAPLYASLALFDAAGMPALNAKSQRMNRYLREGFARVATEQLQILTPAEADRSGCQLSIRVAAGRDAGRRLFENLTSRGVIVDWREPDILRMAPAPLYNSYADLARCLTAINESVHA